MRAGRAGRTSSSTSSAALYHSGGNAHHEDVRGVTVGPAFKVTQIHISPTSPALYTGCNTYNTIFSCVRITKTPDITKQGPGVFET
ncbi:unnamed protein product [Lota lota]